MLEDKLQEIEDLVEKKKERIKKDTLLKEKELTFIKHLFYENYTIISEYVKKEKISIEDSFNDFGTIIRGLTTPLYIEANDGKTFTLKEVNELLPVKLGYYTIRNDNSTKDSEPLEQCSLDLTPKGEETYLKYRQL
jgi:hypothetical protein